MFRFLVNFTKVIVIACIIGVSLRVIDIIFLREKPKDVAINNTINETQNEEILEIVNDEKDIEEQSTNETKQEIAIVETKKEADSNQNTKVEKKINATMETKEEDKKEEQQENSNKVSLPEITKQEAIETKSEEKYTEVEVEIAEKKECKNNNHGMSVGNSGKWFNTKEEAIATYKQESKMWGDKWKNNEISDDEYYRNCPYGYEIWSCMYCGKWTINYYYDN